MKAVPGLEHVRGDRFERDDELEYKLKTILKKLEKDANSWPFEQPVDPNEVSFFS